MKTFSTLAGSAFAGLALLGSLATTGCASRAAPFDELDKAPITMLRIGQPPPPPAPIMAPAAVGGIQIPGLPAEMNAGLNQAAAAAAAAIPGLASMIPGMAPGGATPMQPAAPQVPLWNGFAIIQQQQVADEDTKEDLLDLFGDEDNFEGAGDPNNFRPGFGVSIQGNNGAPIDLLVSFSSNQVRGVNLQWPHQGKNTFSSDGRQELTKIYSKLFGPIPVDG